MSTGPVPTSTLTNVVAIMNIVATLEPVALQLVMKLMENMKGKSTEEILAETDSVWAKIRETAQAELS